MNDITELAQSLKAAAEKATHGQWLVTEQDCRWNIDDENGRAIAIAQQRKPIRDDYKQAERTANAEFIALANPANILALVEALEKAQQRIYQLESSAVTVKLPNSNDERFWGYGSEFEVELYDSCVFCALAAAGIKVEAE